MVKVSMKNKTVICAFTFLFGHGAGDYFVDLGSSIENIKIGFDNMLIVFDIGFSFDVGGSFFNDVVNSACQIGEHLHKCKITWDSLSWDIRSTK